MHYDYNNVFKDCEEQTQIVNRNCLRGDRIDNKLCLSIPLFCKYWTSQVTIFTLGNIK